MALTLWRRKIAPMPRRDFEMAGRRGADPAAEISDDYLVEGEELPNQPSTTAQVVQLLQVLLIVVLAVVSLAVFWLVGLLLNIF